MRLARMLATQYWRRSQAHTMAGISLTALNVFDSSIDRCLHGLKINLMHAPELMQALRAQVALVENETRQSAVGVFAHTCLDALVLQAHNTSTPVEVWHVHAVQHPTAVADAFRFCFNDAVAAHITAGIDSVLREKNPVLTSFLLTMACVRPGVNDAFSAAMGQAAKTLPGGLAALCQWRCLMQGDEAQAEAAIAQDAQTSEALMALALMGSPKLLAATNHVVQRDPNNPTAVALFATLSPEHMRASLIHPQGARTSFVQQLYCAALLGEAHLLQALSLRMDWAQDAHCRALCDSVALLSGVAPHQLFDPNVPPAARASLFSENLAPVLHSKAPMRLGRPKGQAFLEESAPLVGGPLRHMLYTEYVCHNPGWLLIGADDAAYAQAMAVIAATVFERAQAGLVMGGAR